jgi:farnesyl diphosphate synthase
MHDFMHEKAAGAFARQEVLGFRRMWRTCRVLHRAAVRKRLGNRRNTRIGEFEVGLAFARCCGPFASPFDRRLRRHGYGNRLPEKVSAVPTFDAGFLFDHECYIPVGLIAHQGLSISAALDVASSARIGKPFMSIAQRLETCAQLVEVHLAGLFQELARPSGTYDAAWPQRLAEAMRHAALGGGKRIRPFLVIETAALFGLQDREALNAAAAVECVHCYSLAHDDLPIMDNDELRRGAPTVWKRFDEWTAILAGDALLTLAFEILARPETHPDPLVRSALVLSLARASGAAGMAGGQALDLAAGKLKAPLNPPIEHVRQLQKMKTGALIRVACEMGALLAKASPGESAEIARYGDALGRAFQIADDLLDAEGDPEMVGKKVAKDAAAGKATFVSHLGIDGARLALRDAENEAKAALKRFGNRSRILEDAASFVANRTR